MDQELIFSNVKLLLLFKLVIQRFCDMYKKFNIPWFGVRRIWYTAQQWHINGDKDNWVFKSLFIFSWLKNVSIVINIHLWNFLYIFFFLTVVQCAQCDFRRKFDTGQSKTKLAASDLDKFWRCKYTCCCYIYNKMDATTVSDWDLAVRKTETNSRFLISSGTWHCFLFFQKPTCKFSKRTLEISRHFSHRTRLPALRIIIFFRLMCLQTSRTIWTQGYAWPRPWEKEFINSFSARTPMQIQVLSYIEVLVSTLPDFQLFVWIGNKLFILKLLCTLTVPVHKCTILLNQSSY